MAIRNVESTLPDRKYVMALESELADLRADVERMKQELAARR